MAARLNVFADAVVDAITNGLAASDSTEVQWSIHPDVLNADFDPTKVEVRQVYVVPVTRKQTDNATRGRDEFEYEVAILTANRFTGGAGDPSEAWVRAEMAWQETYIDDLLSTDRTADTTAEILATFAYCSRSEPLYAYDADALQTQRMFYSLQSFAFTKRE